ncbi:MAG: hypothetical protein FJ011_01115 [Chloroflexi bacterium]|nr:hypothetical protein [Chloroflexota bacterium]
MGNVYNCNGRKVGSVNAWSGVYDASGRKVGSVDIYSDRVYDASGRCVGTADWHGNVHDASGRYLCQVAFFGGRVKDARGDVIGSVEIAGAPEPPPDMQWRGAAALLLLCLNPPPERRTLEDVALEYLSVPSSELGAELACHGPAAVEPLVRMLLSRLITFGQQNKGEPAQSHIRDIWDAIVYRGIVVPALEVIGSIGGAATQRLIGLLSDRSLAIQKLAALLVATGETLDSRSSGEVAALIHGKKISDTSAVFLPTFAMARAGDARARQAMETIARKQGMGVKESFDGLVGATILELLGWESGLAVRW